MKDLPQALDWSREVLEKTIPHWLMPVAVLAIGLLTSVGFCVLCCLGLFIWVVLFNTSCRDQAIATMPIYPESELVATTLDFESNDPSGGAISRTYEASDAVEQVIAFYDNQTFDECRTMQDDPEATRCRGLVDGLLIDVVIEEESQKTVYEIEAIWSCPF